MKKSTIFLFIALVCMQFNAQDSKKISLGAGITTGFVTTLLGLGANIN